MPNLAALCVALFSGVAAAADATPPNSDIIVKATTTASAADAYVWLQDLGNHRLAWPQDCARRWEMGEPTVGMGATAETSYRAGAWRRRLVMEITKLNPDRRVDIEHQGNKGFTTTWTLTAVDGGTEVELHTWINPPPWPFYKTYFKKTQPKWTVCHQAAVDAAAGKMAP
jgi:Polyketide cyclase / dehydrase and lipid transport